MSATKPKSVFITGASSGLGYSLSIEFAKKGYRVFAGARRVSKLKSLEQYGVKTYEFDIVNTESIYKVKELISEETGGELDILYNNVGVAPDRGSIFDQDIKVLRQTFDANYFGHVEVIQAFQHLLLKSKGLVAFTDSVIDLTPAPFVGAYAASKAAFHQLGEGLALEINALGLKVVQVRTGRVNSEIDGSVNEGIPKDSIYYLEDQDLLDFKFIEGQDSDLYAKNVVNDIEKVIKSKHTFYKTIYRGGKASLAYWINWLLPFWVWSYGIIRFMKIDGALAKIKQRLDKPKTN